MSDISMYRVRVSEIIPCSSEIIDWGLQSLGISEVWRRTEGEGIKIAILDSGIDDKHPDLIDSFIEKKDFTNSPVGTYDRLGHGTHVAGIIAARSNGIGIIGVAPKSQLIIGKVLNDEGCGNSKTLADAIEWAAGIGADVISLSLGSCEPDDKLHQVIIEAINNNKIIVAAAGNYGSYYFSTINYPAKYNETISVGSVDRNFQRAYYSSTGEQLDIMAPGEQVFSCYPHGMYAKLSGTSMATPFVSGVVALCLAKHRAYGGDTPCRNHYEMLEHLARHAIDLGKAGPDRFYGYGLIDPVSLINNDNS